MTHMHLRNALIRKRANYVSEMIGDQLNPFSDKTRKAAIAAAILAGPHSAERQRMEAEHSSGVAADIFVPGVAAYNRVRHWEDALDNSEEDLDADEYDYYADDDEDDGEDEDDYYNNQEEGTDTMHLKEAIQRKIATPGNSEQRKVRAKALRKEGGSYDSDYTDRKVGGMYRKMITGGGISAGLAAALTWAAMKDPTFMDYLHNAGSGAALGTLLAPAIDNVMEGYSPLSGGLGDY